MGLLTSLVELRRDQSTLANPSDWLVDMLGGGTATRAGRRVTPDTALSNSAMWNAIRLVAGTIASLPLHLYRRLPAGGKERASDHRLHGLLHRSPNPRQTAYELMEMLAGHVELRGNAYARIEADRRGQVVALWPLHPGRVNIYLAPDDRLWYEYTTRRGERVPLKDDEVLHLRGFSSDGVTGLSPVGVLREAFGVALAAEEHAAAFYGNGTQPGGVLRHPGRLTDKAHKRLVEAWNARHQGSANAWKPAILEEGMEWTSVGMSAKDAQFLETRRFQVEEVARIMDVPPHMLKSMERATFSNIEHQDIAFLKHSMRRRLVAIEQRLNMVLLLEREREDYFFEFLVDGIQRGDTKTRYDAYAVGRNWGWLSADDIRELENMNPLPNGQGKIYLMPTNMLPAGSMPAGGADPAKALPAGDPDQKNPDDPDEGDGDRSLRAAELLDAYEPVFVDAFQRATRKELSALQRRAAGGADAGALVAGHETFWREHEETVAEQLMPAMSALLRAVRGVAGDTGVQAVALARAAAVREHEDSSRLVLRALADQDPVHLPYADWRESRARSAFARERPLLLSALCSEVTS